MRKIIILVLFSLLNIYYIFAQTDIGYRYDCCAYYSNIIYEKLLTIIDTSTITNLINKNCRFMLKISLVKETGTICEITLKDTCHLLSEKQKEEFENILYYNTLFNICHDDEWRRDKLAREVYPQSIIQITTSSFYFWWYEKTILKKKF
jgi:hypothetical protein